MNIRKLIDRLADEINNCKIEGDQENNDEIKSALSTLEEIEDCVNDIEACANNIDTEKDNIKKIVY